MKHPSNKNIQAISIMVGSTVIGCILIVILYSVLKQLNLLATGTIGSLIRIGVVPLAAFIAGMFFLRKNSNTSAQNSITDRLYASIFCNFVAVIIAAILINQAQLVLIAEKPVLKLIQTYENCFASSKNEVCKKIASNQLRETMQDLDNTLSSFEDLLGIVQVVAAVAIVLILISSIVAFYKFWMVEETSGEMIMSSRRKTVEDWYVRMSAYSVSFIMLMIITFMVLPHNQTFQNLKELTPIALGILGLIEGGILLSFAKDIWNYVLVEDWHMSRKSDSMALVSKELGNSSLCLIPVFLVFGILLVFGMVKLG